MLKEYCGFRECPFTSRTIVVTTLSGVVLLLYTVWKKPPISTWSESKKEKAEQVQLGKRVVLLLMKYHSKHEIQKIHKKHLGWLSEEN
jgi:hypothetical protein